MNTQNYCNGSMSNCSSPQESRSSRFNLPVRHPSKWQLVLDQLLSSPMRIHRYRNLSNRIFLDTMDEKDCGSHK